MNISILTVFSQIYDSFLQTSLIKRAQEAGTVSFDIQEFFSFCEPKERIDSPTFGHGAGMVIKPEVVQKAVEKQETKHGKAFKIFLSPQGKKLDQTLAKKLSQKFLETKHVMLISSRYEGMDSRVEEYYADESVSVGDVVLMGGDVPTMMLLETVLRYVPGVVGKQESVEYESFSGPFVDYPQYAAPVEWNGIKVPDIVRSGDHGKVSEWREAKAAEKTVKGHFEWLRSHLMTDEQKSLAASFIPSHYVVLMHDEILLEKGRVGTTSVASLDIHDIARSSRTYGLKKYFIVTPLEDQQKIIQKLLSFWDSDVGKTYNRGRHDAVSRVCIEPSLQDVLKRIEEEEGKNPVIISTSAQESDLSNPINYYDQEKVWSLDRPVLFVLGTGRGLSEKVIKKSDFVLLPINGFSNFNHLSVRSAAAIIFDRWFGISTKGEHS
ncbi:tRNA (guanosine(37)-N1)-methyltransferase TrmD [bacterium]|jgi:tRNA (guanine37-N1)-methyltransferase|nr:tRNA (guanosine(37)-N1)-methyltransferase TrmD [bacterium]